MLHLIWVLIIGAVIGAIAGWLTNRCGSMSLDRQYHCRFDWFRAW